jgi:hypothetical protein
VSNYRSKTNDSKTFRSPDHEFDAYLIDKNERRILCDCKLWLPKIANDNAQIELWADSSPESFVVIGPGPLEIKSQSTQGINITATDVWIESGPARVWPARKMGRSEIIVSGIGELRIIRLRESNNTEHFLDFTLSDCPFLNPQTINCHEESGKIEVETVANFDVFWPNFGQVLFGRRYHHHTRSDIHGIIRTSTLSARLKNPSDKNIKDIKSTLQAITDICLISSFAARQRMLINEYRYVNNEEICEVWIQPLRRYNPAPQDSFAEGLVEKLDFVKYFKDASSKFTSLELVDQKRIREAIYSLAPVFPLGVESQFLAMFSAFEALVHIDRKPADEISPELWKIAKKSLANAIDGLDSNFKDEFKDAMKEQLTALKRPTLRSTAIKWLNGRGIEYSDLWNLFNKENKPGLYQVRNFLAHGNRPDSVEAIGVATLHLRVLIERILLNIFGFDLGKSKVSNSRVAQCLILGKDLEPFQMPLTTK